jgi:hypothetical protein
MLRSPPDRLRESIQSDRDNAFSTFEHILGSLIIDLLRFAKVCCNPTLNVTLSVRGINASITRRRWCTNTDNHRPRRKDLDASQIPSPSHVIIVVIRFRFTHTQATAKVLQHNYNNNNNNTPTGIRLAGTSALQRSLYRNDYQRTRAPNLRNMTETLVKII